MLYNYLLYLPSALKWDPNDIRNFDSQFIIIYLEPITNDLLYRRFADYHFNEIKFHLLREKMPLYHGGHER